MDSSIGDNIVKYCTINGISQKYLASKLEISVQGLSKIEKGKVSPRAKILEKFIRVSCIISNQLFGLELITEDNSSIMGRLLNDYD